MQANAEVGLFTKPSNLNMKMINNICKKYKVALCYIFGSQKEIGRSLLEGKNGEITDAESDIDFAVLFETLPLNSLETYARLSLDLQDLLSPFKADLLFLHEVDHLIQLEAIKGFNIYSSNDEFKETYEEKVMMFASDELEIFKLNEKDFLEAIDNGYFEFKYQADTR
jgi:predicted nucleotidyltransferase